MDAETVLAKAREAYDAEDYAGAAEWYRRLDGLLTAAGVFPPEPVGSVIPLRRKAASDG